MIERRSDGETWRWCVITRRGEVLAEFASHDDAAAWLQQNARAPRDKARKIERERTRQ